VIPSQAEFKALLQRLREQQTESPTVDGKADLPLETEGDRAFFIRHVAALANNVEPSHLIIGVEDQTWDLIGLSADSPLRDSDLTQRRMNHILANRLDPNISVRYRTHEVSGVVLGLVAVEGTRAPYIIAIEDQQYGGDRTRGEPSYVYRGAIYVRRGANSVIANRQSEILEIIRKAQGQPDEFLEAYNYTNVETEDFGRHQLSERLVEVRWKVEEPWKEYYVKAQFLRLRE
jgi:predicted HTH transcriptional regulator